MRKIVFFSLHFKWMKKCVFRLHSKYDKKNEYSINQCVDYCKLVWPLNSFFLLLESVAVWCTIKSDQINRKHQQTGQHTHTSTNFRMFDMQSNNAGLREFPFPFAMHSEKRFCFWKKNTQFVHSFITFLTCRAGY